MSLLWRCSATAPAVTDCSCILSFAPSQDIASRDVPLLVERAVPARGAGEPSHHLPVGALEGRSRPSGQGVAEGSLRAHRTSKILEDPDRNALLLKGNVDMVARALAMIEVLDQPLLQSRHGLIIEPLFMQASDMANALNSILRAEGYESMGGLISGNQSAGAGAGGSVVILALQGLNKVVVFALDEPTLDHIEAWAVVLDASRKDSVEEAVFTYEVRNTQAEELVETLNQLLGAGAAPAQEPRENRTREGGESGENDGQLRRDNGQPRPAGQAGPSMSVLAP